MQSADKETPRLGIIFDSGMTGIDEVLTLALLCGFQGLQEARLASISLSRSDLKAAAFCDSVVRFYGRAAGGQHHGILPIGLSVDVQEADERPMIDVPLSKRNATGGLVYEQRIGKLNDTAEPSALIRNALTAQHDQNCVVVLTGPATNLAKVLDLPGVKELIATKVRLLALSGGAYPEGQVVLPINRDIPAFKKVLVEWPTPIIASGYDVGKAVSFPATSVERDFVWAPDHPIADAYRAFKSMPYDAPTWSMAPALYAVRPEQDYFRLSEPGTIQVLDSGRTRFGISPKGHHRYLILDASQKERALQTYTQLASTKPTPKQSTLSQKLEEEKKLPQTEPPKRADVKSSAP
jgi:hypothetical protein